MDVLIVADDLTGAMDTGHGFARKGYETVVRVSDDFDSNVTDSTSGRKWTASVGAANTDTRYAPARAAQKAVTDAISTALSDAPDGHPLVYKKVDSTLRGNVVAELEAATEASGASLVVIAPAFPAAGRTTVDGVHLVDDVPLTETEYAEDEQAPTDAHLPTLLSRGRYPVTHVALEELTGETEHGDRTVSTTIRQAASQSTPQWLVFDATRPDHLRTISTTAASSDERVLYVGSGGLANHVSVPAAETPRERSSKSNLQTASQTRSHRTNDDAEPSGTGALGVVGSVSDTTLGQLEALPPSSVIELDPTRVLESPESAGQDAGVRCAPMLEDGGTGVLTGARSAETVERTLALGTGDEYGLEPREIRDCVRRALASAARATLDVDRPAGLFVTGGDVAVTVCRALETETIELTGTDVADGVPLGRIATGPASGLPIVTKAGGFGDESVIVNSLNHLRYGDTP